MVAYDYWILLSLLVYIPLLDLAQKVQTSPYKNIHVKLKEVSQKRNIGFSQRLFNANDNVDKSSPRGCPDEY